MYHLLANFAALANVANTEIPALQDDVIQIRNNRHTPGSPLRLYAAYSSAVTLLRTRLNTPHIRDYAPSFLLPIGTTLLPISRPPVCDMRDNPQRLTQDEGIVWESTDSAAGPNDHYILTWVGDQITPIPSGDVITVRGTSTTAAVASTWSTISVLWDTDLAAGNYVVIGGQHMSTNGIAFSCIFERQAWRPGGVSAAGPGLVPWIGQVQGGMGVWGTFRSLAPPIIRVLCDAADAAHVVHLQVIRVP